MLVGLFCKGSLIGFSVAMPVGPVGILCIQNSIARGLSYGLASGLGAALADALYGSLAGFGVSKVHSFVDTHQIVFQVLGALFLWYLGWSNLKKKKTDEAQVVHLSNHLKVFLSTFLLTLTNPMTIFSFAAVFAAFGVGGENEGIAGSLLLTWGIFFGSVVWWMILCYGSSLFRAKIKYNQIRIFNRISGILLIVIGVLSMILAINHLIDHFLL